MKQKLSKFIAPLMVLAAFAIVVSVATAWTGPTGSFPTGNVAAPLNTGSVDQTKSANLGVTKSLFAGDSSVAGNLVQGMKGYFLPECSGNSILGPNMLLCYTVNAVATDIFRAGLSTSMSITKGIFIDSAGSFFIKDGNQAASKVLTSDANGKATWQALPAQDPAAELDKIPLYKKNPACAASDTLGGSVSTNDKCLADACVKFNGSPASSFANPYPSCIPVSGGQFSFPQGTPPTAPYECRTAGGLSVSGLPTTSAQGVCNNVPIGYYVGVGTQTTTPNGLTWTPVTGQGTSGQTCVAWLGVPGNAGRVRLLIGTTVVWTDQCIYINGSTTARHDATWSSAGWSPKSPASNNGQVYTTEKAI